MNDKFWRQLLEHVHGDESERAPDPPEARYRVTITWVFGANVRAGPNTRAGIVRVISRGTVFETAEVEILDPDKNRWLKVIGGYICTYFYGTQRARVEKIKQTP